MTRIGFVLKVRDSLVTEYRQRHREVWPEMLDALRSAGWHNYSLFMNDEGLLFGYFETPESFDKAQAAMDATDVNARWQAEMSRFFEIPPGAHPDQMMVPLDEVFHLE